MAAIPYGKTVTSSALAQRRGCPRAVRAVGVAVLRIPC
ncbi:MAG: MGMT family protein [Thermomicrobium sp.]|nr:MGMT family protein [Thermomicrobium sp.]